MIKKKIEKILDVMLCHLWSETHRAAMMPPKHFELIGELIDKNSNRLEKLVKQAACGWQKKKPDKECYFVHRYKKEDNYPDLYEAKFDNNILCVFNIQDDEFIYTMEEMADGEFFIIEK